MTRLRHLSHTWGLPVAAALLCAACASQPKTLYYWGSYQSTIYSHLKGDKGPEAEIQAMEKDKELALAKGEAVPPGFRAHLGILYGEIGRTDQMVENLEAEKRQYPESATFMDFLLKKAQATPAPTATKG